MKTRTPLKPQELLVALALIALGIFVVAGARQIAGDAGYAQVGPRVFPYIIGAGLLILGGLLAWQAVSGGWRNVPDRPPEEESGDWAAFGILSAGVILHMVSIGWAGFILASTFLFILIARGFGSRRLLRDAAVGILVSGVAYLTFTYGLGLKLPGGLLGAI